jgi:hypothetical protein
MVMGVPGARLGGVRTLAAGDDQGDNRAEVADAQPQDEVLPVQVLERELARHAHGAERDDIDHHGHEPLRHVPAHALRDGWGTNRGGHLVSPTS